MTSRGRWNNCHLDGIRWNVVPVWFILFLLSIFSSVGVLATQSPINALKEAIFLNRTYHKTDRPVVDYNDPVNVSIDLSLTHIVNVHEKDQYIHLQIWIRLAWTDAHINWKPADYGGIRRIVIPVTEIWKPDIVIYNEIGLESGFVNTDFRVKISSDGLVEWFYPKVIQAACKMDVSEFPFDKQKCHLMFGSWAYDGLLMVLKNKRADGERDQYQDHGEWRLTDFPGEQHMTDDYACCPGIPYYDVTYTIHIQRRSLYYTYTLVFPCICLTFLCITGFLLPVQSGERISMNLMILLAQVVLLLVVFENMPAQSEVIPVIGVYIGACIVLITFSTVLNIFILYIYFRGTRGQRMPAWMRKYILHAGACLMGYRSMLAAEKSAHAEQQQERKVSTALRSMAPIFESTSPVPMENAAAQSPNKGSSQTSFGVPHQHGGRRGSQDSVTLRSHLRYDDNIPPGEFPPNRGGSVTYETGFLKAKLRNAKFAEGEIFNEWKVLSFVLDRLFFILYFIITLILTLYIIV